MKKTTIHLAMAYWCDDLWVIAAGRDRRRVLDAANEYMAKHAANYTSDGVFANPDLRGRCADGYYMDSVEETP